MRWSATRGTERGITLLDTVVGTALMLVVFLGIGAAFKLSIDVVLNNKAQAGAIALADERMEYIRSLAYASIGTVGGIPSGTIPQSESVSLNGLTYTRRTLIEYVDDPKDGLGAADQNHITSDYKAAKVDISWTAKGGTRHITIVTRIDPPNGMETACTPPCGTLTVSVVNAASAPLSGASVSIVNSSVSPAVNLSTFTDTTGTANLIGAPTGSGYAIVVTNSGYSTAQTYTATAQNTNPNPGNLTVSNGQTTTGTFAIDVLGTKTVNTWQQISPATWTDPFSDATEISTSTNISVAAGTAKLISSATRGEVQSIVIQPTALAQWASLTWSSTQPSKTTVRYYLYDGGGVNLIPNSQLPGNSGGFAASPINLANISTTTYPSLRIDAVLMASTTGNTPTIDQWSVGYTYGPVPLPSLAFSMRGAKTIGSGPSGSVYKYSQSFNSGATASLTIPNLEWDSYLITVSGTSTGYDISSACNPQPEALTPGQSATTNLYFAAHTVNSFLVDVRAASTGALIPNASVNLTKTGYNTTIPTDSCGQAFFSGLTSSSAYSISVSAAGHTTYSASGVTVAGTSRLSVSLN